MRKEEILERSRSEQRDEGKEFVLAKGRKSGINGMVIIFCILAVYNLYNGRQETNSALIALMFGYLSCESLGIYTISKRRRDLLKVIIGAVISIYFLVNYLML